MATESPTHTLTLRHVLLGFAALLALLNALGALLWSHPSALLLIGAAVIVIPPARRDVEQTIGVSFSRGVIIIGYMVMLFGGNLWFATTLSG